MKKKLVCLLILGACGLNVSAQFVNTGELVVAPGTTVSTLYDFNNTTTGTFINDGDFYVYAHWNNDGMVDFLGTTGQTRFVGLNEKQQITGAEISYLYNTVFSNTAAQPAFELSGALSVSNEAEFSVGIVDNSNFDGTFIFEQEGTAIHTSNNSFVDGTVLKVGDRAFDYPIGDDNFYRLAAISAPEVVSDEFSGSYIHNSTNLLYPTDQRFGTQLEIINASEYWEIERQSGSSEVLLTLSWDEATTDSDILREPYEAIHIARWDVGVQAWVDEGGAVDVAAKTVTTSVDTFGIFTLARINEDDILPCNLMILNLVTPNNDGINDYFEVMDPTASNCAQHMKVSIFNRWGALVYEEENYETTDQKFGGYSDGSGTLSRDEQLPVGTYFYILSYEYEENTTTQVHEKAGFLYINN